MKQTKLFVVVVFALFTVFAATASASTFVDVSQMSKSEIKTAIFDGTVTEEADGYNLKGVAKTGINYNISGIITSTQWWDGTQTISKNTGDNVECAGQELSVWLSTNTDPANDSNFVSVDISEMKRSEVITTIFESVSNDMLEGGYGVTGRLVTGKQITISGVLTGLQDGTEYTVGDTVNCNGQAATAWFSVNTDEDNSTPQITSIDISSMTKQQVLDAVAKKVISADIGNGGAVVELKEDIAFIVSGELNEVQDGTNHTFGATVYGRGQTATLWFKVSSPAPESGPDNGGSNPGEGENGEGNNPEPQTFTADQLISAGDLKKYFTVINEGTYGEIQVEIPALTTIEVHEAWDFVSTGGGKKYAGEKFTTGATKEQATFWPNVAYWEAKNSVQLTSANLSTFLSTTTGDTWKTATLTSAAEGKKLRVASSSDLTLLTRKNGQVTEPDFVNSETEDEIIVAKKADVDNSNGTMFESTESITKASPAPITINIQQDGKVEVIFFCGTNKLRLFGSNLFKYSYDTSRCKLAGEILSANDGYVIGTMTVYLNAKGNSNSGTNGGSEGGVSGSGGGGGGCNGFNLSSLLLLAIPMLARKRS